MDVMSKINDLTLIQTCNFYQHLSTMIQQET